MPPDSASHQPLSDKERVTEALCELDATPEEIADLAPIIQHLNTMPRHHLNPTDTLSLLAVLAPLVPRRSAVRQAVTDRAALRFGHLVWMLDTTRAQIGAFRSAFWLGSAVVTALGVWIEVAAADLDSTLLLLALGPLLAYLGISTAFRGIGLRTYECELACPPSALQITLARLVIVLGYDVGLGLCLSLAFWLRGLHGETSFLAVTLHWLMPLLLVAGLGLVLSLRLSSTLASGIAYGSWLAVLASWYAANRLAGLPAGIDPVIPIGAELALGVGGLALLAFGTQGITAGIPRILPGA